MIKKMMIKKKMIKKKMTIKEWVKNMTIQIRLIIEQKKEDITLARDNNSYIGIKKQKVNLLFTTTFTAPSNDIAIDTNVFSFFSTISVN